MSKQFEVGQKLMKRYDGRTVEIAEVHSDSIVLDGDFEPKHLVMKDKVLTYYHIIEE